MRSISNTFSSFSTSEDYNLRLVSASVYPGCVIERSAQRFPVDRPSKSMRSLSTSEPSLIAFTPARAHRSAHALLHAQQHGVHLRDELRGARLERLAGVRAVAGTGSEELAHNLREPRALVQSWCYRKCLERCSETSTVPDGPSIARRRPKNTSQCRLASVSRRRTHARCSSAR